MSVEVIEDIADIVEVGMCVDADVVTMTETSETVVAPAFAKPKKNPSSPHWNTPLSLVELVREFFGGEIDLDPCSNEYSVVGALREIMPPDDGLAVVWTGRVWMNPPFGRGIGKWFQKAATDSVEAGAEVLAICNSSTETAWFQDHILARANAICYPRGRVEFLPNPLTPDSSSNTKGHAIVYYGFDVEGFEELFSTLGHVDILKPRTTTAPILHVDHAPIQVKREPITTTFIQDMIHRFFGSR